jgi:hypothetical protein
MLAEQPPERVSADPAQEASAAAQAGEADSDSARGASGPGFELLRLPGTGHEVDKSFTRDHDHGGVSPEPRGISDVRR